MDLGKILDIVIPIGIILFVASILYGSMKPMFDKFFDMLKNIFGWMGDKASGTTSKAAEYTTQIVYKQ